MTVYEFAKGLILEAGINVKKIMKQDIEIETKSNPNDLVTNVDKATEKYIFDNVMQTYPEHLVIGEEGHGHNLKDESGVVWVIDPIDGTLNFVHQKENFAISIGVFNDGKPYAGFVFDVMNDVLYHAKVGEGAYENGNLLPCIESSPLNTSVIGLNPNWLTKPRLEEMFKPIVEESRSVRAYGSAALEIICVATGKLGGYITPRLQPWDFAGGLIILQEVGGIGTDLMGNALSIYEPSSIVMANPQLHAELLEFHFQKNNEIIESLQQRLKNNK